MNKWADVFFKKKINQTFQQGITALLKDVASICQRFKKKGINLRSQLLFEKETWSPKLSDNLCFCLGLYVYICVYILEYVQWNLTWLCVLFSQRRFTKK